MFLVKQLAAGGFDHNFSYVLFDPVSKDCAVVDPCGDANLIHKTLDAFPEYIARYILITHGHPDHVDALEEVQKFFPGKTAAHPGCRIHPDIPVNDHDHLTFGDSYIEAIYTPGHAVSSICWLTGDQHSLFTGDTLFIGCCGYCNARTMFQTMREKIYPLPDSAVVYSGHDYGDMPSDTLGHQKQVNPFLYLKDYELFKKEVKNL